MQRLSDAVGAQGTDSRRGGLAAFRAQRSEQYEARLTLVRVPQSQSVLLRRHAGSVLPIAVAHGEGRAEFDAGSSCVSAAA